MSDRWFVELCPAQREEKKYAEEEERGSCWCETILEVETRLRVAQGIGKSESEACAQALRQMQEQGQATLPAMVSDGWGGIREAMVEVYGEVPAYGGRGRPPTRPQARPEWRYLQMVKHRSPTGKLLSIEPKAVYGTLEDLHDLGLQTSYIERTHLSMRQHHAHT